MSAPPIVFTITDAGRLAALDALNTGLTLSLTELGIGTGQYTPTAAQTALQTEVARFPLSGGDVEQGSQTLRFSAVLESGTTQQAFEVGLFSSTGVLFAVSSTVLADPLVLVTANISFIASFGLVLTDIPANVITVVTDLNAPLALVLHQQHLAALNPHPQYTLMVLFQQLVETVASLTEELMATQDIISINAAINLIQERLTALEQRTSAEDAIAAFVEGGFDTMYQTLTQGDQGYQKLPSGLILQWGRVDLPVADLDDIQFSFPEPFAVSCYNLQTSVYQQDSNLAGDGAFHVKSFDINGGNVFLQTYNSQTGTGNLNGFYWSAIGR